MKDKEQGHDEPEIPKSEIVRAHERLQQLPEEVGEKLDGIHGEIYEAVNKGEFP